MNFQNNEEYLTAEHTSELGKENHLLKENINSDFSNNKPGNLLNNEITNNNRQQQRLPRILIVDDDYVSIKLLEKIVGNKYEIEIASKAKDAINKASEKQFDIILMDINLGVGDTGLFAVEEIRKIPAYKDTPIIAVTAFAQREDKLEFLSRGCSHYVSKPFDTSRFIKLLDSILNEKH